MQPATRIVPLSSPAPPLVAPPQSPLRHRNCDAPQRHLLLNQPVLLQLTLRHAYLPLAHRLASQRDVRYHKLMWVESLLRTYRWVFFTDCDALFVDFCIDVGHWPREAEAGGGPSAHLILTGDQNWAMNSGQFFIRNTSWARSLLEVAALHGTA